MEEWIAENWLGVINGIGVIGSLLFTAITVRRAKAAQSVVTQFTVNEHYRELWEKTFDRGDLERIRAKNLDLEAQPITEQERRFVQFLINHLAISHRAMHSCVIPKQFGLQSDIAEFFTFPIPKAVWEDSKRFQDPHFTRLIDSELK